jgi:predicted acyl esterase
MNTGEEARFARNFVPAANMILHDTQHPSALILPVVSGK